jgi:hypothetical protein
MPHKTKGPKPPLKRWPKKTAAKKDPLANSRGDYYDRCTRDYPNIHANSKAYNEWFIATEPTHGGISGVLPSNSRALSSLKAKSIMAIFISRLMIDVIRNSTLAWTPNTPLPNRDSNRQPLADNIFDEEVIEV